MVQAETGAKVPAPPEALSMQPDKQVGWATEFMCFETRGMEMVEQLQSLQLALPCVIVGWHSAQLPGPMNDPHRTGTAMQCWNQTIDTRERRQTLNLLVFQGFAGERDQSRTTFQTQSEQDHVARNTPSLLLGWIARSSQRAACERDSQNLLA